MSDPTVETGPELEPAPPATTRAGSTTRRSAALLGAGVIGGGWAARFLLNGWNVRVHDPDPDAADKLAAILANARASLPALTDVPLPPEGELRHCASVGEAVEGADWIQESLPERLEPKRALIAEAQAAAPEAPLGSSTSGYRPSQLQEGAPNPASILVAHPFNPVYLLPLVEVVPSAATDAAVTARAHAILESLGMYPLRVRHEIDAHIADRLLEAVWREALWLVRDGIATTGEIDDAIRFGFGLRWAQMGLFETYRIAGGAAGMRHFLDQFGPSLKAPWTRLTEVPDYDAALVELIAGQSDAQSGAQSVGALERLRDDNLVGILRALKERNSAAGKVLNHHDNHLRAEVADPVPQPGTALELAPLRALPGWTDAAGRMRESRALAAAEQAAETFAGFIGADRAYAETGFAYIAAESHILHVGAAQAGDALIPTLQVLEAGDSHLHLFIRLTRDAGTVATVETLLHHVTRADTRRCAAAERILERLRPLAEAHAALPRPEGAGRRVAQDRTR